MWLDNRPDSIMSTCYFDEDHDACEPWPKKEKR